MDRKPQKPPSPFGNPFSMWTEFALKLWGFGKPAAQSRAEKQPVAVIPTRDAQSPRPPKVARAQVRPKRAKAKVRGKSRSKRARR